MKLNYYLILPFLNSFKIVILIFIIITYYKALFYLMFVLIFNNASLFFAEIRIAIDYYGSEILFISCN